MSPTGRPKGEYRKAQPEGCSAIPTGRPKGEYRKAQPEGCSGPPTRVELAGPVDWPGFVHAARGLVAAGLVPEAVSWQWAGQGAEAGQVTDLFAAEPGVAEAVPARDLPAAAPLGLPADWVADARLAALHADVDRWALLYRAAWRIARQPGLAADPLDADMRRIAAMARQVRREAHKMKAFVRFRPVAVGEDMVHVAWFEPLHQVQEHVAPFFMRRFAQMRWAILTPRVRVLWDGHHLAFGPGAEADEQPAPDAGEALWLAYYRSIFNPARLKMAAMKREMPVRYWPHLPEARLIAPLAQGAVERAGQMVERAAAEARAVAAASGGSGTADASVPDRVRRRGRATEQLAAALRAPRADADG